MTATAHPRPAAGPAAGAEDAVRAEVVNALALQGVQVSAVTTLFDGREWGVTVTGHSPGLAEGDVRVAVWNTVLNCTALYGVRRPVESVRVRFEG
ncbi:hypothetical protein AS188_00860 [Kocuria flava]|uniref:BON domain-containing protein n=1 Tax=Kocuria flava TaxID=446860 RepID=A0A0U3HBJ3_9MICC|nr:hypothetical protein [Kocuria flava]ALU38537.1 hypothetical protein AS188_00860 [Kocuria flava]GEO92806.1 hypothetical protein KFL01_21120 [Kocuria flava]